MANFVKRWIEKIPEFSEKNYTLAGYICAGLVSIASAVLVYSVLTHTEDLSFSANWNIFKSPFGSFCIIIGLFCAIIFWGKMGHWSRTPVIEKRNRFTGEVVSRKEDMDIIEQMFAKIGMPFIGHFIIEPLAYGCLIYYPIQCIIALVGTVFPYILTLLVLAIAVGSWFFTQKLNFRFHSLVLIASTILFTVGFGLSSYAILSGDDGELATYSTNGNKDAAPVDSDSTTVKNSVGQSGDTVNITNPGQTDNKWSESNSDDQFGDEGPTGLLGSLSKGTTKYVGDMAGFPIEFTIHNDGELRAEYKNVKYGTTMRLAGESLPAQDGGITFYGKDKGTQWTFDLIGDADNITGEASDGNQTLKVTLHRE